MNLPKEYYEQIQQMARNANDWFEAHPDVNAKVQFNYTRKIFMIAPISEAIKDHIVSCDEAGLELVKAMWPWDDVKEPTVTMVKAALDFAQDTRLKMVKAMEKTPVAMPPAPCPVCHYVMDQCSSLDDKREQPRPGDVTLCLKCGEILVFETDHSLRKLKPAELDEFHTLQRKQIESAQTLIRQKRPLG